MTLDPEKGDFKGPLRKQVIFFSFNSLESNYGFCRHYVLNKTFPYFNGHIISNKWCQKAMGMQFSDSNFKDYDQQHFPLSRKHEKQKSERKLHELCSPSPFSPHISECFGIVVFWIESKSPTFQKTKEFLFLYLIKLLRWKC